MVRLIKAIDVADKIADCIPVVSTIKNTAYLLYQKIHKVDQVAEPINPGNTLWRDDLKIHVISKDHWTAYISMVPVLGNAYAAGQYIVEAISKACCHKIFSPSGYLTRAISGNDGGLDKHNLEVVRLYLARNPNRSEEKLVKCLRYAASIGKSAIVELILNSNSRVWTKDSIMSALRLAGNERVARKLLAKSNLSGDELGSVLENLAVHCNEHNDMLSALEHIYNTFKGQIPGKYLVSALVRLSGNERAQNLVTDIINRIFEIDQSANPMLEPSGEIPDVEFGRADGLVDPEQAKFQTCDEQEILGLRDQVQQTNRKYPRLDLSSLDRTKFPIYKMQLGEVTYYCSEPYLMKEESGHAAVMALVKIGNKVFPRTFYFSRSQASWRSMPSVEKRLDGEELRLGHYNKGLFESDTQLPFALNIALMGLRCPSVPTTASFMVLVANMVLTEVNYQPPIDYRVVKSPFAWSPDNAPKYFVKDGRRIPHSPNPRDARMPREVGLHPNFGRMLLPAKEFESQLYGKLTAKVYASNDNTLQYLFLEASDGRAFLAGIERVSDNPINSYGIRKNALDVGVLTSPLFEYRIQISPAYEDTFELLCSDQSYGFNWNYVRELEIIQMYYIQQRREVPPKHKVNEEQIRNLLQSKIDFYNNAARDLRDRAKAPNLSNQDKSDISSVITVMERRVYTFRQNHSEGEFNAIMGELIKAIEIAKAAINPPVVVT